MASKQRCYRKSKMHAAAYACCQHETNAQQEQSREQAAAANAQTPGANVVLLYSTHSMLITCGTKAAEALTTSQHHTPQYCSCWRSWTLTACMLHSQQTVRTCASAPLCVCIAAGVTATKTPLVLRATGHGVLGASCQSNSSCSHQSHRCMHLMSGYAYGYRVAGLAPWSPDLTLSPGLNCRADGAVVHIRAAHCCAVCAHCATVIVSYWQLLVTAPSC
jgi:hypothetical protein